MSVRVLVGDMREQLKQLPDNSVDSVACDPPYHLTSIVKRFGAANAAPAKVGKTGAYARASKGFMGQTWDGGDIAFDPATWAEVWRVLKPGGHLVAFGGTRTYHRLAVAIEDAGFEVRDMLAWHYGSGFPKSHDISKAIDRAAGAEREIIHVVQRTGKEAGCLGAFAGPSPITTPATDAAREWEGYGTALKPATEPICLARKPLSEKSIAANVLKWGTGALNIDGCRIEAAQGDYAHPGNEGIEDRRAVYGRFDNGNQSPPSPLGRWPANLCHDGSDEVLAGFPAESGGGRDNREGSKSGGIWSESTGSPAVPQYADSGSAARFFYCAKASKLDRLGSDHPTVKPVELMRWLVRLVTPPGGTVLDPFAGSGSTGIAAWIEQRDAVLVELRAEAAADIERRLGYIRGVGRTKAMELAHNHDDEKRAKAAGSDLPLFGSVTP